MTEQETLYASRLTADKDELNLALEESEAKNSALESDAENMRKDLQLLRDSSGEKELELGMSLCWKCLFIMIYCKTFEISG